MENNINCFIYVMEGVGDIRDLRTSSIAVICTIIVLNWWNSYEMTCDEITEQRTIYSLICTSIMLHGSRAWIDNLCYSLSQYIINKWTYTL